MTRIQPAQTGTTTPGPAPHLPALDGLRGVAIAGVLLFHTGYLDGGFLGVDLFFALSGYLITDLLLREVERTGTVSLVSFWGRRIRRLLPALSVMLASIATLVWAFAPPETVRTTLSDGPWVQANLVNWHLLAESAGYWDRFGPERVFEHLWSIAVEEQFYLVWPLVVVALALLVRRIHISVALTAVLASAASLALMVALFNEADPSRVYTGTDTRAFSLLLGAAVATGPVKGALARIGPRPAGAAAGVLVAGLAAVWALADGEGSPWLFKGGLAAHALASALLIGLCAAAGRTPVSRVLAWLPLRWLGLISYSLYLWHWPVIALLSPERTGLEGTGWALFVCVVSIWAAVLSKYLVEDPIRFRARWARGKSGFAVFAAVMAALALLWFALPEPPAPTIDLTDLQ